MNKIKNIILYLRNFFGHLKTILTHKYWVFYYCYRCDIPWQGLKHDLSKFSPIEFFESVKYWSGTSSPIDASKKANGHSMAWLHHKGRNKHHYEYWQDNFNNGGTPIQMPFKYATEMLCDFLGAGRAYMKDNFTFQKEYEWWRSKINQPIAMHPQTKLFIDMILKELSLAQNGTEMLILDRDRLEKFYNLAENLVARENDNYEIYLRD